MKIIKKWTECVEKVKSGFRKSEMKSMKKVKLEIENNEMRRMKKWNESVEKGKWWEKEVKKVKCRFKRKEWKAKWMLEISAMVGRNWKLKLEIESDKWEEWKDEM